MVSSSRVHRIVLRSAKSTPFVSPRDREAVAKAGGIERPDSATLITEINNGLNALEAIEVDLNQREQELLAESSVLYEQLRVRAQELSNLREQQAIASEKTVRLKAALQELTTLHPRAPGHSLSDPTLPETLAVQSED